MKRKIFVTLAALIMFLGVGHIYGQDWPEFLNTARDAEYLSGEERLVIFEMNKARYDGAKYADMYLKPMLPRFRGNLYQEPGKITIQTGEGKSAVEECIMALTRSPRREPLQPSQGLSLAARDHVQDTGPKGITSHNGSDGSTILTRIQRYGSFEIQYAENISFVAAGSTARDIVIALFVDDGVANRGHRETILSATYRYAGTSIGPHRRYGSMCVIDFAAGYREGSESSSPRRGSAGSPRREKTDQR